MAETLEQHQARVSREASEADTYLEWCEARGLDPDEDHWESYRLEMLDARDAFLEDRAESLARYR